MGQLLDSDGNVILRVAVVSGGAGGGGSTDVSALNKETTQVQIRTAVQNIDTDLGTAADAAATTDTGAFTIVSLLKRGLQRWTSLLDRMPASLGGKTSAASLPVVIASDQAALAVNATTRACVGRETIALAAAGTASLTVPPGALAAHIQADGATIRIRLDGTEPTATIGTRLDDGVIYPVDTALANVRLYGVGACNVQVVYFDRA